METQKVAGIVLAFGVSFAILAGSGVGASVFGASPSDAETTDTLGDIQEKAEVPEDGEQVDSDTPYKSDVSGDNEPTTVGFVISGAAFLTNLVSSVALLPLTLTRLGFPNYFAVPVGAVAQIIAGIGVVQFTTGREYM